MENHGMKRLEVWLYIYIYIYIYPNLKNKLPATKFAWVWSGVVYAGLGWSGMVRFGVVWGGLGWSGVVRFEVGWLGLGLQTGSSQI